MTTLQEDHSNYQEDKDIQSRSSFKKSLNKNYNASGLGSEFLNANHNINSSNDNDDNDDDAEILYSYEFKMTDDQKKAAGELQSLKLNLGFTEDEPGSYYDVSERLRQLNKELAEEELPALEERSRRIQFKENLIDFVAPPPDHDMEDELETSPRDETRSYHSDSDSGESLEHKSDVKKDSHTDEGRIEKSSLESDEKERHPEAVSENLKMIDSELGDASTKREVSQHEADEEETVVLERNGRFEVVAVKDLTPEEREIYVTKPFSVSQPRNASHSASDSSKSKAKSSTAKKPERKSSETLSVSRSDSSGSSQKASNNGKGTRVVSAQDNSHSDSQTMPATARPSSQRSLQKKQKSSLSNIEKYEQKRKEDETKRQKEEESERLYQEWLKKKKEQEKKENRNKKENKDDKDKQTDKDAFEKWKAKKEQQMLNEKKLKEEEAKYYECQWQTHSETECEENFKKWLKAKQKEAKEKEEQEREKLKAYRRTARRSHTSANAGSVDGQGSSAYIDYYGYRF